MNIKKAAVAAVVQRLENDKVKIQNQLRQNKRKFENLVNEQTQLKRQLPVIQKLINGLTGSGKSKP